MNGSFVVDTNVIIDILRGKQELSKIINNEVILIMPTIVLGELFYGANKSNRFDKKKEEISQIKNFFEVTSITERTAEIYGEVKNELKLKGKPIPENDIWIASVALELNLPLLTKDKHFSNLKRLKIIDTSV